MPSASAPSPSPLPSAHRDCRPAFRRPPITPKANGTKYLRLDPAPAQLTVRFAPGSSRILPGDLARLRATVASAGIVPVRPGRRRRRGAALARRRALPNDGCVVAAVRHRREPGRFCSNPTRRGRDPARAIRRDAAALPRLEQAGRRGRRFHEHGFQQFRLRRRGQSRLDGGNAGRSGRSPSGRSDRCTSRRRGREQLPNSAKSNCLRPQTSDRSPRRQTQPPPHRAPERAARERAAPPCSHDSRDRRNRAGRCGQA